MASKVAHTTKTQAATHCRQCKRPRSAKRPLSLRALCGPCREANMVSAAAELQARRGPAYDAWVDAMVHAISRARTLNA